MTRSPFSMGSMGLAILLALATLVANAADFSPSDKLAVQLAREFQKSGRLDDAERQLAPLAKRQALDVDGVKLLGEIAAERGQWSRAEALYRAASALAPNDAGLHLRLGQALQSQGRFEEADRAFARYQELTQ